MNFPRFKRILAALCIFLTSCGTYNQVPTSAPTRTMTFTRIPATAPIQTPTFIPRLTTTATLVFPTSSPFPSLTPTTPTVTLLPFDPIRRTPATLMLHRKNAKFDAVVFLAGFVKILKENDIHVITYRDISNDPGLTAREQGHLCIITIDDIFLQYGFDPSILQMIDILREANYPAVLSIVTEGKTVEKNGVALMKELTTQGWEIATHTDVHQNLGKLEKLATKGVFLELRASLDKIENALGLRPITLVLPEGQMVDDPAQIKRAGIVWIVGINGGISYNADKSIHYIGREGPSGTAEETFSIMMKKFNP